MRIERVFRSGALLCALILSACSQEPATVASDNVAVVTQAASPLGHDVSTNEPATEPVLPPGSATEESVRIYVDPATGEIREPSVAEESASAAHSGSSAPAGKPSEPPHIREIHLPDGSTAVIQDRKNRDYLKACVGSDDRVALDHGCNGK